MGNIPILIRREVEDHAIHFVLAFLLGCISSVIIYVLCSRPADSAGRLILSDMTLFFIMGQLPCLMALDAMALARVQMAGDRGAKVSAFICTLTPTRGQLFIAKWISGLAWVLLAIGPILLMLGFRATQLELYAPFIKTVMTGVIVMQVTAYAMGQQIGFLRDKGLILVVGALFLCLLASLLVIKGFAMPLYAILTVLTVALSVRSWWAFQHMAL